MFCVKLKNTVSFISLFLVLCLTGCEPSQAENLYNAAVQLEQRPYGDRSYATVEAYREVIRTAPQSSWAEKAQKRIDVINQSIEAQRTRSTIEMNNQLNRLNNLIK